MKEPILDILIYLFEHFITSEVSVFEPESAIVSDKLESAGFHNRDIIKAIKWLTDLKASLFPLSSEHHNSTFRIFSTAEQDKLTTDSRHMLYCLERDKIITPGSREIIIDRAMAIDLDEVDVDELKWVMLFVLYMQGEMPSIRLQRIENAVLVDNTSDAIH